MHNITILWYLILASVHYCLLLLYLCLKDHLNDEYNLSHAVDRYLIFIIPTSFPYIILFYQTCVLPYHPF